MPSFQWTHRLLPFVALTTLALTAAPEVARANNPTSPWERVGVYEGRTLYIDPTTARKSGSRIQIFTITDLKEPNATARGRTYWSKKALLEFDCNQRTLKILQDSWYPRKMAQGEAVFHTTGASDATLPVQSDSPAEILWKAACGRR